MNLQSYSKSFEAAKADAFAIDRLAICGTPDAPALVTRAGTLSYKMLNHRVGQLAKWLQGQGYEQGDRVATWLPKTELACLMPLATARIGLIHVPVNPLLKPAQVSHILRDSGARMIVSNKTRLKTLENEIGVDQCQLVLDKSLNAEMQAINDPVELSKIDTDVDNLAAILYTSGSTGRPKGVMLSHANLSLGAMSVAQYLDLSGDDRTLCVLPLSFDYGQNQLFSTWAAGGCAIPLDYLTPRDVMNACAKHQITTLAAVPPLWVQLVEQEWPEEAVASMRRLTNSGGALTVRLVEQLRDVFSKKTDIFAMYGLTEAFRSTFLSPDLIDANPTSMGTAIPYAEILVIGDDGKIADPGDAGELVHAGPLVAQGYWQDEKRTAERFKPAPGASEYGGIAVWSGDKVKRGNDGLLYFIGREDLMIKSSGNRISPSEIEEVALAHEAVMEAVAMGIPDERLGHSIKLYIRTNGNFENTESLTTHFKNHLPNFMQPHDIAILDAFPKNPNGKLDRNALKLAG